MLFAVFFEDKPEESEVRKKNLIDHIQWLERHKELILVGGSLREHPSSDPLGGLWLVEAESKETVTRLIHTDPFWIEGLRKSFKILHWSKAFPHLKTLV
ncbi:YciI family protein [Pseudomonas coronafaciens]|uniref:YciI family protein n=1 Tax=Pseudomonas coronafaciens TaxID=53409 RepID=UPI000F00DA9C|nr:YciI family protein [Pseudomonas coronafaciens]RMP31108.1 hypothetical protein ALQ25_200007 [Pseudomonas coronafaciens pv. atropurpurea]